MQQWSYKFVISERFKMGLWFAISEDDKTIEPELMHDKLNKLGQQGWELITVIPIGESVGGFKFQVQRVNDDAVA